MKLRQIWVVMGLSLFFGVAVLAQGTQTDTAYAAGYNVGYAMGQQDEAAGVAANPHKFREYQQADSGYTPSYGSRDQYRQSYQSGFDDGYGDGYAGRTRSIAMNGTAAPASQAAGDAAPAAPLPVPQAKPAPEPPAPPPPPPAAPVPAVTSARGNGYREGYNVGQSDANRNIAYDAHASHEYQDASLGYTPSLGDRQQYELNFRSGFATGYDDGFNHRLFNAAVGRRQPMPLPAGANSMPTDPEVARARPSGVYDNGTLVAEGTAIQGTLDQTLDTKNNRSGDTFSITVTVPVWVGAVAAIPAGSVIHGTVQQVTRGGKLSGHASMQMQYDTLVLPGQAPISLHATTAGVGESADSVNQDEGTVNGQGSGAGKRAATGAAIGGVLGGIFGGYGGLIRGGIAGAAVGTAGAVISHKKDIVLKQGEHFRLRLDRPLEIPTVN